MLFLSFPFHPSGPFCSSLCSWLLGWTPSLQASVSFSSVIRLPMLQVHRNPFFIIHVIVRGAHHLPDWCLPKILVKQTDFGDCANLPRPLSPGPSMRLQGTSSLSPSQSSSDESLFTLCAFGCQQAGIYWVTLIDQFVASWVLLFLTLLEIIGVCYIYGKYNWLEAFAAWAAAVMFSPHAFVGGNRFIQDIEMMLGKKSFVFWLWWRACWFCISPCIIVVSKTSVTLTEFCVFSCFVLKREQNLNNCQVLRALNTIKFKKATNASQGYFNFWFKRILTK